MTETAARRAWRPWVVAVVALVGVSALAVVVWNRPIETAEARRKAAELQEKAAAAGLPVPRRSTLVHIFGTDGGPVCPTEGDTIPQALHALNVGRTGEVNGRPVIIDRDVVKLELLAVSVYCPEKLRDYEDFLADLKFGNTVGD